MQVRNEEHGQHIESESTGSETDGDHGDEVLRREEKMVRVGRGGNPGGIPDRVMSMLLGRR